MARVEYFRWGGDGFARLTQRELYSLDTDVRMADWDDRANSHGFCMWGWMRACYGNDDRLSKLATRDQPLYRVRLSSHVLTGPRGRAS